MFAEREFKGVQLFAFTYCSTITVGVTFFPYLADTEVRSAWLKVLIGVIPYLVLLTFLKIFTIKYDSYDFFSETKQVFWTWVNKILLLYFIFSTFLALIYGLEALALITTVYLLPQTSRWLTILLLLTVSGIGVLYGIKAISRFVVSLVFLEIIAISIVILMGFNSYFRWLNIHPIWSTDIMTFMKSSISDTARYAGVIMIVSFLPHMKKGAKIYIPSLLALLFIVTTYVSICLIVLGTFGFEQALTLLSPVIALVQSASTRTGVFERLDLFFLATWIIAYFKMTIIHIWFLVDLMKRTFSQKIEKPYIVLTILVVFTVTTITPSFVEIRWNLINYNHIFYSSLLPIVILTILIFKKKKGVNESEQG